MIYLLIGRCNAPKGCNKNLRRKKIILVGIGFLILLITACLTEGLQDLFKTQMQQCDQHLP